MKALILAAGLGTRLLPYTRHTPKPLFTLDRQPILERIIAQLLRAGCRAIMVNTHHLHEQLADYLQNRSYPIAVELRHEPVILGTGGAIRNIADFWPDAPLLIINADIVSDIDLAEVYRQHCRSRYPVTMVMHDQPRFNSVRVDRDDFVTGFKPAAPAQQGQRLLAFTGIHVIGRRVLDFLPPQGPAHIIDAYTRMLQAGEKIKALIVRDHYWQDIGTPESYKAAVLDQMAPQAFAKAFGKRPAEPVRYQVLQGDGSDRRWSRLCAGGKSLVMVDHGIRAERKGRTEADAFVDIGRHLHASGAAVPEIYSYDTFSGIVLLEDLGDCHLQQAAVQADQEGRERIYRQVIDCWLHMAVEGGRSFDPAWTYQSQRYDKELILEKECRYFIEAFLKGYLAEPLEYGELAEEFEELAEATLQHGFFSFMHRDLQSRNIMLKAGRIGFIDFQGGRLGPLQYDLASLLIDPYVGLSAALQDKLKNYAADELRHKAGIGRRSFLAGYELCALTRNLQMLGAFGFLSRVKGKTWFESYIPRALQNLLSLLSALQTIRLPGLAAAVERAGRRLDHIRPHAKGAPI